MPFSRFSRGPSFLKNNDLVSEVNTVWSLVFPFLSYRKQYKPETVWEQGQRYVCCTQRVLNNNEQMFLRSVVLQYLIADHMHQ